MYEPLVGLSRQPRIFSSVLFPIPDGAMIETDSPLRMLRETPRKIWTSKLPF